MSFIRSLSQHWLGISMLAYLFALIIQQYLIFPLEISLTNENAALASFLFLPHAVRVLSAWLLGPKSLIAMIPVAIALSLISDTMPHTGYEFLAHIIMPTFSACSAVMAFEFMRFCKIDAYPKDIGVISWRTVLFGGVFASIINSLGSSWLKSGLFAPSELMEVIIRFILGDTLGLLFGMLIIMLIFRQLRQMAQVSRGKLMSNRKVFADLLKVTQSMEADLGLSALTQTDKQVLASVVLITEDGKRDAFLDDIRTHSLVDTIPTPSLYRSLKTLIQKGMVQKVGSERSGIYRLA